MKVALVMYGHLRTYKNCFAKLKENFLNRYNVDIFIHTWDEIEAKTRSWHNRHMDVKTLSSKDVADIKQMYNPKGLVIQHQPAVSNDITTPNNAISSKGQEYMLHSMFAADQLKNDYEKANNFKYDVVVKIRPDILLMKPLILPKVTQNTVNIAGNRSFPTHINDVQKFKACDIINISTSEDMSKLCDVKHHFNQFFVDNIVNKKIIHSGFVDHALSKGLTLNMIDYIYNRDWTIVRKSSK